MDRGRPEDEVARALRLRREAMVMSSSDSSEGSRSASRSRHVVRFDPADPTALSPLPEDVSRTPYATTALSPLPKGVSRTPYATTLFAWYTPDLARHTIELDPDHAEFAVPSPSDMGVSTPPYVDLMGREPGRHHVPVARTPFPVATPRSGARRRAHARRAEEIVARVAGADVPPAAPVPRLTPYVRRTPRAPDPLSTPSTPTMPPDALLRRQFPRPSLMRGPREPDMGHGPVTDEEWDRWDRWTPE